MAKGKRPAGKKAGKKQWKLMEAFDIGDITSDAMMVKGEELIDDPPKVLSKEDLEAVFYRLRLNSQRSDSDVLKVGWWMDLLHSRAKKQLAAIKKDFKKKAGMEYQAGMRKRRLYLVYGKSEQTVKEFMEYGEWVADRLSGFKPEERKAIWKTTGTWPTLLARLRGKKGKAVAKKIPVGKSAPMEMKGVVVNNQKTRVRVEFDLSEVSRPEIEKLIARMKIGLVKL
jgi:hypothetical protein